MPDGGRTALSGFLYQIVGLLGLPALAYTPLTDTPEELDVVLAIIRAGGDVAHEHLDQDVAVLAQLGLQDDDQCVLIQYKFSRQHELPNLARADLLEIVEKFALSTQTATTLGQVVTRYIIITNRPIGPSSTKLVTDARNGIPIPAIADPEQYRILQALGIIPNSSLPQWEQSIRRFGQRYGCRDQEITAAIERLIGRIVWETAGAGAVPIHKEELVAALVGSRDAEPLQPSSTNIHIHKALEDFRGQVGVVHEVVRRTVLADLTHTVTERALIFLSGPGGSGKTVTLWHWHEQRQHPFIVLEYAGHIQLLWAREQVHVWTRLPYDPQRNYDDIDDVLERLCIANPDLRPPLLHLGLDSIDDQMSDGQEHIVRAILRWFAQEDKTCRAQGRRPRATLIATCRGNEAYINTKWLRINHSGFRAPDASLAMIPVGDFDASELLEAARVGLPDLYLRFAESLRGARDPFVGELLAEPPTLDASNLPLAEPIPNDVIAPLHHPAMFRAFVELPAAAQQQVLDLDAVGMLQLATTFIEWFVTKAYWRHRAWSVNDMLCILEAIAAHCANQRSQPYIYTDWKNPCCHTDLMTSSDARTFYDEAEAAGLIMKTNAQRGWRWRHPFIQEYLATGLVELGGHHDA